MKYFSAKQSAQVVFVILPGNPGKVELYLEFMQHLYNKYKQQIDIYGINYLGHVEPTFKCYSLMDQTEHCKVEIYKIKQQHPNVKLYLLGHSVGAFIALKLEYLADKLVFLFPSIDDFKATPNAKIYWPLFTPIFIYFVAFLVYLTSFFPASLRLQISILVDPKLTIEQAAVMTREWDPRIIYNTGKIVQDEFEYITALDLKEMELVINKCWFILSPFDGWCDIGTYRRLATKWPNKLITRDSVQKNKDGGGLYLTDAGIPHAFIVGYNMEVAEIVYSTISL